MTDPRKIDALVAEHVFSLPDVVRLCVNASGVETAHDWYYDAGGNDGYVPVAAYSSDIAAAWDVVTELRSGLDFHLSATFRGSTDEHWRAAFTPIHVGDGWHAVGDNPALAICLAALRAKGITV